MKKLFRTSKPTIEPLPPPPAELRSPPANNVKKSFSTLMGGGGEPNEHKGWGFGHSKQEVTPFPMELGRETPPPPPPKKKDKGGRGIPTLLELQNHQQQQQQQQPRWDQAQGQSPGPDEWAVVPPRANGDYGGGYSPPSGLYLPPGARPPSPPPPIRPTTPLQHPYAHSQQHSQASLHSNHYEADQMPAAGYRDRGYSSASNLESDHEGSLPVPKMRSPAFNNRSPLAHSYASDVEEATPPAQQPVQQYVAPTSEMQQMRMDEEMPKEKKRFWGWGDKKGKEREGEDGPRHSESLSGHDHDGRRGVAEVNNVDQAIQILCSSIDPPLGAIYDACDRVNQSENPDSIAKETAKALRKWFKHGSERERKAAAKVWLIMMRNISVRTFRQHAGNKKFLHPIEVILTAPSTRPVLSAKSHKMLTEILADLTYLYGQEKGCEGLLELWKKVKLPQESDFGTPLPPNHPIFMDTPPPPERPRQSPRGPTYAALPSHQDDIRRLMEESTAAKESARVLLEALVYTRPDELASKPIINEFYRKCFLAHESLTNQMEWAQAEASHSRENANVQRLMTTDHEQDHQHQTLEEQALGLLFEAHSALAEGIKQHDDLEKMAMDEREMREVRERSRTETRIDRGLLAPGKESGSSSREPSPHRQPHFPIERSRTPSPDQIPPIKIPSRAPSPLRARGPRPLPVKPTSSSNLHDMVNPEEEPPKPSRKAMGKRRAVVDEDNHFDPDDMFKDKKDSSHSSDESVTADDVFLAKPVIYAYDAYQERLEAQNAASAAGTSEASSQVSVPRPAAGAEGVGGSGGSNL